MSTRSTRLKRIWSVAGLLLFIGSTADSGGQTNSNDAAANNDKVSIPNPPGDELQIRTDAAQPSADAVSLQPNDTSIAPPLDAKRQTESDTGQATADQASASDDQTAPRVTNPRDELEDARATYATAFAAEQYAEAGIAANRIVTLTSEIYGSESIEYALACGDLAAVQSKAGELSAAATNYKKAIYLIEEREGIVSAQLIKLLMGLAAVQNSSGQWDLGLETYNRALRLNHVELGLNNIEQMPIRDGLTESYLGLGSIADANFQQEVQMRIVRDEFSNDPAKLTQASNKLAGWYERSGQQEKEIWQREMTVRAISDKRGDDGTLQIKELRDLAAAYQRLDLSQEEALNAYNAAVSTLNEAARINNARAKPDPVLGAEIQIEIGDVHNVFGAPRDARRSYTQAWKILTDAGVAREIFEIYFGTPTHIGLTTLPAVYPDNDETREIWRSDPDRFRPASLQALIDVDDYGHTDNIRITESNPENVMGDRATDLLERYRYRPRFENGQAVATVNMPVSHAFSYLPDDKEATDDPATEGDSPLEYPGVTN